MNVFQDFEYMIAENQEENRTYAMVLQYTGTQTKVIVPYEIEGFPVVILNNKFGPMCKIEEIILPDSLEQIGYGCFWGCVDLKKIHFPPNLKYIGGSAFRDCTALEEITMSDVSTPVEKLDFHYEVFHNCPKLCDENGYVILNSLLIGYYGKESHVIMPDGVTAIAGFAFWKKKKLKSAIIPDSVISIGAAAFEGCTSLEQINIPEGVTKVNSSTFEKCKALEQIILPENLTYIGHYAFSCCSNLKEIHWGKALKTICGEAFSRCTSLDVIHFPEGLEEISDFGFVGCINLIEIHIPASVKIIRKKAFEKCDSLEIIEILDRPEGTEKQDLQISCFPYSAKMREHVLEKGKEVPDIITKTFNKAHSQQYLTDLFASWDKLSENAKDLFREEWKKKITVKVKKGKNRLRNLVFLESAAKEMSIYFKEGFHLELPELEEYLEFSIKKGNTAETALLLDYKNKTFDKTYLEELETRKELIDIGLELPTLAELREKWTVTTGQDQIIINGYHGKSKVEILPPTLADGTPIRKINKTYDGFKTLKKLTLPEGIEEIGESAFKETSLEVINIPSTVKYIGTQAFHGTKITEITLPGSLDYVNDGMFWDCAKLEKVILPDTITMISESAFKHCVSLTDIHIPEGVKKIKSAAFFQCHKLENISLPDSVEIMERVVFDECYSLVEIHLPASLTSLGNFAFLNCHQLKRVILPSENVKIGFRVWSNCPSLEFIGVESGDNLLHKYKEE